MSIEWVIPSSHLILCHPLLFLPSIFSSIRVFSNKSVLHPKSLQMVTAAMKLNFGHLMQRTDSLEKTLVLGKIEGGRRRRAGGPRMEVRLENPGA